MIGGIALLFVMVASSLQEAREPQDAVVSEREGSVFGTTMRIVIVASPRIDSGAALDAAQAELRRVEELTTVEPERLAARAGEGPVPVPKELTRLVRRALVIAEQTGGAFDPTWKALAAPWGLGSKRPSAPDAAELEAALELVGHDRVRVKLGGSTIELPEGFRLDLGDMARGYALDRAMAVLRGQGIEHARIEVGGDLKVAGQGPNGEAWELAVRDWSEAEGPALGVVPLSDRSVVTAGRSARFFEIDGERFHPVFDPRTGRPSRGCRSATVIGPDAATCGALAMALCVLTPDEGLKLVEGGRDYEALVVDLEGEAHATKGLADLLR